MREEKYMRLHVGIQISLLGEALIASWKSADEWLLACMFPHMNFQRTGPHKSGLADSATIRPIIKVLKLVKNSGRYLSPV